jgi:hypothetical protein
MWFAIDMTDGTESRWFYWPMLGTGLVVAVTAIVLVGVADCSELTETRERSSATYTSTKAARINREPATSVCSGGVSVERQCLSFRPMCTATVVRRQR